MDPGDAKEVERIRNELHEAFLRLEEELERARRILHTSALLGEESLGQIVEFEAAKRLREAHRARDKRESGGLT